jgi:hypothetical protein
MARTLGAFVAISVSLVGTACMGDEQGTNASGMSATVSEKAAPDSIPQATAEELEAAGLDELPLAPAGDRVDLMVPSFSKPTEVTNPLFPISGLHSAILNGTVDDKPFKVETTLLPETRIIEWPDGRHVETLVSQYVAYLDGRIEEVALDFYAQADDGSVWYFGEDVFNYDAGFIADSEGTWIAGKDGPAAMIMPADPQVGNVYRPENVPGFVFEEVTVKSADETVEGPQGPVEGAIIAEELHQDGAHEDKTFAPGYGEFFTGSGGDVEALALAVPTDALAGEVPDELETMLSGANSVYTLAGAGTWKPAARTAERVDRAWQTFRKGDVPPRLEPVTSRAVKGVTDAIIARGGKRAQEAALDLAQAVLDLELRNEAQPDIDRTRFVIWAQRFVLDAAAKDEQATRGDLATLEWISDRFVHTLLDTEAVAMHTHLVGLRTKVTDGELRAAAREAEELRALIAGP